MSDEVVSFEQKLENVKKVLEELSNPEISLAEGMKKYKDGIKLLEDANKMIEEAKIEYETLQSKEEVK
ncbi:MAG TPA: exodeoxyribonuclease VII small subunit [Sulfurospirillum sp. UBA11407]|jgi:exodeoxyribonuclease VII small subunit|nr:MAG TPA: exodeoxyribonuclease VII small subunit [Sulfurospirillum sp. UBA11407]DAB34679.1 MAG TPA: exodeoxyribonuclease VII small subunit [Sulfurospirillum sp. UBA12182]